MTAFLLDTTAVIDWLADYSGVADRDRTLVWTKRHEICMLALAPAGRATVIGGMSKVRDESRIGVTLTEEQRKDRPDGSMVNV